MNKAERAWLASTAASFLVIMAAVGVYALVARPWFTNWGTTPQERTRALPGDDAWIGGVVTGTRGITIQAPPEKVWPWLIQIGQDRAGFYSYAWLENLALADIHNTYEIRPEWQTRQAKDLVRGVRPGYLFGLPKKTFVPGWRVSFVAPGEALTLRNWGTFALEPAGDGKTRFFVRSRSEPLPGLLGRLAGFWLLDPAHFVMEKTMMIRLKRLAEGRRPGAPGWLEALATAGFAAAALGSVLLVGLKRRRGLWLLLPAIYAAAIIKETADLRAALAGFLALSLILIGLIFFRKRWWVYFGFLWIFTYAGLFFAADAWTVFGLVFLAATAVLAAPALTRLKRKPRR
jgi:hypothetical protein